MCMCSSCIDRSTMRQAIVEGVGFSQPDEKSLTYWADTGIRARYHRPVSALNKCGATFVSICLGARKPDGATPFFGFISKEFCRVGNRSAEHGRAQADEPRIDFRIGKRCVDFLVERADDPSRRP